MAGGIQKRGAVNRNKGVAISYVIATKKDSTEIVLPFFVLLRLIEPCRAYAINIFPFARQKFCKKYFKENLLKIA